MNCTGSVPSGLPPQAEASQPWTIQSSSIFGGVAQTPFNFNLGPDYWFAKNLAAQESNVSQFCEQGRMQVPPGCNQAISWLTPTFGPPGGYGMMQIDRVPGDPPLGEALWNWRANIALGKVVIDTKAGPAAYTTQTTQVHRWRFHSESR